MKNGADEEHGRRLRVFIRLLLGFILLAGVYARVTGLQWHFSHPDDIGVAKTILQSKARGEFNPFAVPAYWTYAPFQFLFTHFLIQPDQSYRELLFWGRLPSLVSAIAALFILAAAFRCLDRFRTARVLTAAVLLACSWESIINAKQMHSYGIGLTGSCLFMLFLAVHARKGNFSLRQMGLMGLSLAVVSHMHYQILFFMPAFFLALFYQGLALKLSLKKTLSRLLMPGFVYLAAVAPMIYFFLRGRLNSGVYWWSSGPSDEFLYHFTSSMTLADKVLYTLDFFTENLFLVFQANTAFLPENHALAEPAGWVFFILFCLGIAGYFRSKDPADKSLGVFTTAAFAVWFALVAVQKLTLGPTRHSLILLPLMCAAAAQGLSFAVSALPQKNRNGLALEYRFHAGLSMAVLLLFLLHFGIFQKERRDVFIENDILSTLESYDVDEVVLPRDTAQVHVMKSVQAYIERRSVESKDPNRTVAWISRIDKINPVKLAEIQLLYNRLTLQRQTALAAAKGANPDLSGFPFEYRMVYSREIESGVEIDYSSRTKNGSNSLYFYILQRDELPSMQPSTH